MAVDIIARGMAAEALAGGGGGSGSSGVTGIKVNGALVPITGGVASITVPTKVSDLTNDSNFITNAQLNSVLGNYVTSTVFNALADRVTALETELNKLSANNAAVFMTTK